jgi:hypothetical protein
MFHGIFIALNIVDPKDLAQKDKVKQSRQKPTAISAACELITKINTPVDRKIEEDYSGSAFAKAEYFKIIRT